MAKTLLVRAGCRIAAGVQAGSVPPDLMPGDVTGSLVHDARTAAFVFRLSPVFTKSLIDR